MRCLLLLSALVCVATGNTKLDPESLNWLTGILSTNDNNSPDNKDGAPGVLQNNNDIQNKFQDNANTDAETNLEPSEKAKLSCTTDDGKPGRCVQHNYCNEKLIPKNESTIFDYRATGCPQYLLKCCPMSQLKPIPAPSKDLPEGCGWSNPGGYVVRSVAEGLADFGEFPWMVALLQNSGNKAWKEEDYIGGGSLIHPSVVITTAHKVINSNPASLRCRAGEWDTQTEQEHLKHQDRNVKKILSHDQFDFQTSTFNAALLIMERPFVLKNFPNIGTACLGRTMPAAGTICYSMGWGKDFKDKYAIVLKKVDIPLVSAATCQNQLRNTRMGAQFLLHDSLTCAGGNGKDTCKGDGGSSLVCAAAVSGETTTRYVMYGMVAYGIGCRTINVPGVYVKIPSVVDWVDRMMQNENLDNTDYVLQ